MKKLIGISIATLTLLLGLVGVLMESVGQLPPEFHVPPFVQTLLVVVGVLIAALGWQDELTGGKSNLIDIIRKFFDDSIYRKLGLTVILVAAREILALPELSHGLYSGLQIFLALAAVIGYERADAGHKALLAAKRGRL